MPLTVTLFDTTRHHVHIELFVLSPSGDPKSVAAILDTGAPRTEFSDQFLDSAGLIDLSDEPKTLPPGEQTKKYGKIILPTLEICGHTLTKFKVLISHFERSWGIDALIGLDFFRKFRTTIDYEKGQIITEPL